MSVAAAGNKDKVRYRQLPYQPLGGALYREAVIGHCELESK